MGTDEEDDKPTQTNAPARVSAPTGSTGKKKPAADADAKKKKQK